MKPILMSLMLLIAADTGLANANLPAEACRKGTERYHDNGMLKRVYLKETVVLDSLPCSGWTWFFENRRLRQTVLSTSHTFGSVTVPEGSTVFLDKKGFLLRSWLDHDMTIEGIPVDGGGKMDTGFHRNGSLRVAFLAESMEIQGIPCRAGKLTPVYFDSTGTLIQCTLKQSYSIDGMMYKAGTTLYMDPDGTVQAADTPSWLRRAGRDLFDLVFRD
ncbi:hypothetical protein GF324_05050 [bacterium]|nr:hypothetical protein [bacterium]